MTNPDPGEVELTPIGIERKLQQLFSELARAALLLSDARDHEVDARHRYESAHRRTLLSAECPKVSRDGVTAAERDAWVGEAVDTEHLAYLIAQARCKAADDHLRVTRDQATVLMSLGKSVLAAYGMSGAV